MATVQESAKVMIIDDAEIIRIRMSDMMKKNGIEPITASDGISALDIISRISDIKLFICDFNMPEMNGLELVAKIREYACYSSTTVIMLTTETCEDQKSRGDELGIKAWLNKPVKEDKFMPPVKKLLDKLKNSAS